MQRNKPLTQQYADYNSEDLDVWEKLFRRQMALLDQYASELYLSSVDKIGFNARTIPDFRTTNSLLGGLSRWQLKVVPELVPQKDFFELLAKKIFPATCWLRSMQELDYIEEPDMFHDVFGHVPLLVNEAYAAFMEGFGALALKWIDEPEAIALLGRVYWYTIEFGLLREKGVTKIYGAGIVSSIEEARHAMSVDSMKCAFDIEEMLHCDYRTDILQEKYFVIDSFEQLYAALPLIDSYIKRHFNVDIAKRPIASYTLS